MRGKVRKRDLQLFMKRDHPRVCGEKILFGLKLDDLEGSPPRMRGKDSEGIEI